MGDECVSHWRQHFSGGDECVQNKRSNFSHTHTASYQRLPRRPWFEIIATHKYSPPKTGGIMLSYSPPSICYIHKLYMYTRNSVLCWTKRSSSRQVDRENDKRTSTYTQFLANSSLPVTHAFSCPGVA